MRLRRTKFVIRIIALLLMLISSGFLLIMANSAWMDMAEPGSVGPPPVSTGRFPVTDQAPDNPPLASLPHPIQPQALARPPDFPWPPPAPSGQIVLPDVVFRRAQTAVPTLYSVGMRIINALRDAEYWTYRVYGVPNGFALVTRLEQIDKSGAPLSWPFRFADPDEPQFSLLDILRKLYIAPPGRYRLIVFVVSDERFENRRETLTRIDAKNLIETGVNHLPFDLDRMEFTHAHVVTALIYEFAREAGGIPSTRIPGEIEAVDRLRRSRIALLREPTR